MYKEKFFYRICRFILGPIFKWYYNPKIINKEYIPKNGSILIVGNHKHLYDQCLTIIATKRFINYMAKKEYFDSKFAWFFKLAGCIPVDRSKKDSVAVESAVEVLNHDGAVGLFPEGTRNKTDKILLPFKFGAVSMAKKTDSLLVPFAITGDYKFRSKNLKIEYAKPFKVGDMTLEEANEKLFNIIKMMIEKNK